MLGVIGDWIELKSGESWESVWTGLIGAFIIVVCASAVNGKFVKLHPRKMLGYRKKLCQCCQWSLRAETTSAAVDRIKTLECRGRRSAPPTSHGFHIVLGVET